MAIKRVSLGRGAVHDGRVEREWEADVLIVGGAVGGASMAHALAEYSIGSVLLERTARIAEINRGDVI